MTKRIKIELTKEQYNLLLKHTAIGNWVYGVMSDMVDPKYKVEVNAGELLTDKLLEYTDEKSIKHQCESKNVFSETYMDHISSVMIDYENYVVEDLTGIDVDEIDRQIDIELNHPLFQK